MSTVILFWIFLALVALCLLLFVLLFSLVESLPSRRDRIATAALQGLLADPENRGSEKREDESCYNATARLAVNHADALIKMLDETTEGMDTP